MKILVIEDDFITRNYLRDLFRYSGYECSTARNASEGLNKYCNDKPDAIICDVTMPGISGMEFLRNIRSRDSKTPIILITTRSSEKLATQAFRLGANDFLKKPVQDKDILPILGKINDKIMQEPGRTNYGNLKSGHLTFTFKTEFGAPPKILDRILQEIDKDFFTESDRVNIEIGLGELITNAIEHGNLNITYQEKSEVMKDDKLNELYIKRLENEELANKIVTIDYKYSEDECEWTITDQGNGFNRNAVPDPTAIENLENLNGRGIYVSQVLFDSVEYIGKGNIVKVTKKRNFLV